ncbi:MAG: diguanylate cyclase [Myxococcales bacterium]|nr:diguanylate cyclase [Myxococcales bacterium]
MGGQDTHEGNVAGATPARRFDVLLVEPSRFYAAHIESLLAPEGAQCERVQTAKEAKASLAHGEFDLVCVSLQLEDSTGPELVRHIRSEPGMGRVPLVMVTAEQSQEVFEDAYQAGCTEVFFRGELDRLAEYLSTFAKNRAEDRRLVGRVLYLEDTKWLAAVTIGVLHNLGLAVEHFVAVAPALEAFRSGEFDLIITDIVLEGAQSGVSLVHEVRRMKDRRATIPILAMTGLDDAARRIELFRAGVSDYISKPAITEELVARVSSLVVNKQLLETVERQQEQLMRMATVDTLTGLFNRRHLTSMASAAIARARAENTPLSVAIVDIDFFKKLNDTHGHQVGDLVLSAMGELLLEFGEAVDAVPSRFGGEEFLMMWEGKGVEETLAHTEDLRRQIEDLHPDGYAVTASIGVSVYETGDSFEVLFERADRALYRAKADGRNRVCHGLPVAA